MIQGKKEKDYFLPIVVVVGLFILMLLVNAVVMPEENQNTGRGWAARFSEKMPIPYNGRPHVIAIDQKIVDNKFTILSASLYQPGFIVVQKIENNTLGKVIGVSKLLQPGLYSNGYVTLTEPVTSDEALYVGLYTDDGDGVFTLPKKGKKGGDTLEPALVGTVAL